MNKNGPDQQLADLIKHNGRQVAKICSQKKKSEQNLNGQGNSKNEIQKNVPNTFDESYIGISVDRKSGLYRGDHKYLYKSEMVI